MIAPRIGIARSQMLVIREHGPHVSYARTFEDTEDREE